jgi:hypothetical protein
MHEKLRKRGQSMVGIMILMMMHLSNLVPHVMKCFRQLQSSISYKSEVQGTHFFNLTIQQNVKRGGCSAGIGVLIFAGDKLTFSSQLYKMFQTQQVLLTCRF